MTTGVLVGDFRKLAPRRPFAPGRFSASERLTTRQTPAMQSGCPLRARGNPRDCLLVGRPPNRSDAHPPFAEADRHAEGWVLQAGAADSWSSNKHRFTGQQLTRLDWQPGGHRESIATASGTRGHSGLLRHGQLRTTKVREAQRRPGRTGPEDRSRQPSPTARTSRCPADNRTPLLCRHRPS